MGYKVPFLDLRVTDDAEFRSLVASIEKVFHHGRLVMGPEVTRFEEEISKYCGRRYAVGVNSGTDALFIALKGFGIGGGDEVITTSLSWIATANAIAMTGAKPVFADIEDDLNISPECVERKISERTRAILPVHYTGRVCKMDALRRIAEKNGLAIVEDAAQAFGARNSGKVAGSLGDVACFSMNPMKLLAACGEAGIILTDDERVYRRLLACQSVSCMCSRHDARPLSRRVLLHIC